MIPNYISSILSNINVIVFQKMCFETYFYVPFQDKKNCPRKTHNRSTDISIPFQFFAREEYYSESDFRAYTYMFVYNGANHETHGDHISRHGETQNQKAISVAFVRCQFIAACCPWQVKRKTSSGKRCSVSNALMDFFGFIPR